MCRIEIKGGKGRFELLTRIRFELLAKLCRIEIEGGKGRVELLTMLSISGIVLVVSVVIISLASSNKNENGNYLKINQKKILILFTAWIIV